MTPAELREFKQAHRGRCFDYIRMGVFTAVLIFLIAFHRSPLAWALASWVFIAGAGVILMGAARSGDDLADESLRARRQELKAREDTRPARECLPVLRGWVVSERDPMLVYVAGSTKDIERVQHVQQHCTDRGWLIAFDWTRAEGNMPDGSWDGWPELGAEIAVREVNACSAARLTILLSPTGGLGCWIEMGCTLAAGGDVWVVEPYRDSVFWQHPRVRRFETFDSLIATLTEPMVDAA